MPNERKIFNVNINKIMYQQVESSVAASINLIDFDNRVNLPHKPETSSKPYGAFEMKKTNINTSNPVELKSSSIQCIYIYNYYYQVQDNSFNPNVS